MERRARILEKSRTRKGFIPCFFCNLRAAAKHQPQHSSPFAQLRPIVSVVLHAAAACPIFGPRSARAHYLQPPAQLGLTLSQRSLNRASMQLWCRDNKQRVQLVCFSCPLSTLAFRLVVNERERSCSFEHRAIVSIMRRCLSVYARRLWIGLDRSFGNMVLPIDDFNGLV